MADNRIRKQDRTLLKLLQKSVRRLESRLETLRPGSPEYWSFQDELQERQVQLSQIQQGGESSCQEWDDYEPTVEVRSSLLLDRKRSRRLKHSESGHF